MRLKKKKREAKKFRHNFKKVKKFNFSDHKYKIFWRKPPISDAHGLCTPPEESNPRLYINPNQNELNFLITTLDEIIHSNNFTICNDYVEKMSNSIGKFLWKMGWRLPKK